MMALLLACMVGTTLPIVVWSVYGKLTTKKKEQMEQYVDWEVLPSGWTKSYGVVVGYAIKQDHCYYWWVRRGDKTLIEGPARTLELAQYEVEAAAYDFRREA